MTTPEPGLRERKRRATRLAIQRAALQVVRERGLERATVDEIARLADISPRTFFNYFPTKEDAILGDVPTLAGAPEVERFLAERGPILPALGRVLAAASAQLMSDPDLLAERRAITRLHPELGIRRMATVHGFEQELVDIAARRLRAEHPDLPEPDVASRARLVALTAFAFVRHAWFAWLEHPGDSAGLAELVDRSFELGVGLIASSRPARFG